MITHLNDFPNNIGAFRCANQVTKAHYKPVVIPAVLAALQRHAKLRIHYETDETFSALDPSAMWKDLRVGLAHLPAGKNCDRNRHRKDQGGSEVLCFLVASDDWAFLTCRDGADTSMDFCLIGR